MSEFSVTAREVAVGGTSPGEIISALRGIMNISISCHGAISELAITVHMYGMLLAAAKGSCFHEIAKDTDYPNGRDMFLGVPVRVFDSESDAMTYAWSRKAKGEHNVVVLADRSDLGL